jgi:hypothetical protein
MSDASPTYEALTMSIKPPESIGAPGEIRAPNLMKIP